VRRKSVSFSASATKSIVRVASTARPTLKLDWSLRNWSDDGRSLCDPLQRPSSVWSRTSDSYVPRCCGAFR